MNLFYVTGDATEPQGTSKNQVIVHVCNDIGAWGSGFVMALSNKWPEPEAYYRAWHKGNLDNPFDPFAPPFKQGMVQVVDVIRDLRDEYGEPTHVNTYVANLIGQSGTGFLGDLAPVRYGSIHEGLYRLRNICYDKFGRYWDLHMPRIGCGLAGGTWDRIEEILKQVFSDDEIDITVYDLP